MTLTAKERRRSYIWFYIIYTLQWMAANYAHPVTPTLIGNLNLGDYMFGVAFASMCLGQFMFSPFWGKLSDRVGRVKIMLICGLGYGLGQAVFGLARGELGIILGRFMGGLFCSGGTVAQMSYLMDIAADEKERARHFTISLTLMMVVSAFGYLVGGFVGDWSIPATFALQTLTLMGTGVGFWLTLKDVPGKDFVKRTPLKPVIKEANPFAALNFKGQKMSRALLLLSACALFSSLGSTAYEQCYNYYIKDVFNFMPSGNGILKSILGVVTMVVNFTIGMRIMKRRDLHRVLVVIALICGVSNFFIVTTEGLVVFIILNVIIYAAWCLYQPMLQTVYSDAGRDHDNGQIMGLLNSIKAFGNVFGALLAGFLYELTPKTPFVFAAVAFALAVGVNLMANRSSRSDVVKN